MFQNFRVLLIKINHSTFDKTLFNHYFPRNILINFNHNIFLSSIDHEYDSRHINAYIDRIINFFPAKEKTKQKARDLSKIHFTLLILLFRVS